MEGDLDDRSLRQVADRASTYDPDAWEALYRRCRPRLFAFARRRLQSDTAADDAVSETMTRALDRIGGFTWRGAGFDAWVTGILRNVLYETWRGESRVTVVGTAPSAPGQPGPPDPADLFEADESRHELRKAFACLDPAERELLELRVVAGLSSDAVAAIVGKSAGAVRMAQGRALHHLRGHLPGRDHG
ncbi:MAG: RNA polymerase sigma factor [Acidimicrobiia bacterium]